MPPHVCPWWGGYFIDNRFRRLLHDPQAILAPHVQPGDSALDFGCGMGFFSIGIARIVGDEGWVIAVDLQQQMELSAIYRDLIENAMNAYDSIVSHNLNRVIKTLTSISLIVSVPTLIASLYGMNVNLPLEGNPLAFFLIISLSLTITIPLLVYLRIKNLV